jgi:hypothetical protein
MKMAESTGRDQHDLTSIKVSEFEQYYDCNIGYPIIREGRITNDRDITFKSEADATFFLLRFS